MRKALTEVLEKNVGFHEFGVEDASRTWAPRGHPPVLVHTGANWTRLSIAAALAVRWDGRRRHCYFQTRPGSYNDLALIAFLRALKRHFAGRHIILVWDGLGGHKSQVMLRYLAHARTHGRNACPATPDLGQHQRARARQPVPGLFLSSAGPCARASHASVGGRLWPSASCDTRGCRSDMIFTLFHETH